MSTRFCPNGHTVATVDYFCETCGAKIVSSYCSKGHEIVNKGAKFCWKCGVSLADKLAELGNEIPKRQPPAERDLEERGVNS